MMSFAGYKITDLFLLPALRGIPPGWGRAQKNKKGFGITEALIFERA
jgi:hypothetical protein